MSNKTKNNADAQVSDAKVKEAVMSPFANETSNTKRPLAFESDKGASRSTWIAGFLVIVLIAE